MEALSRCFVRAAIELLQYFLEQNEQASIDTTAVEAAVVLLEKAINPPGTV